MNWLIFLMFVMLGVFWSLLSFLSKNKEAKKNGNGGVAFDWAKFAKAVVIGGIIGGIAYQRTGGSIQDLASFQVIFEEIQKNGGLAAIFIVLDWLIDKLMFLLRK